MRRLPRSLFLLIAIALPATADAQLGPARAGRLAQANNAATASSNAAGLTRVENPQWVLNTMFTLSDNEFEVEEGTTVSGGDPKNDDDPVAIPSLFYSRPVREDFRVGFAVNVPMGIGSDYGSEWAGRYMADESSLVFVSVSPVAAWRATERLSLGVNVSLTYSDSETKVAVNNLEPGRGDGRMELEMSGWGLGGGLSALYELSPRTRFGLAYQLESETNMKGTPRWHNIGPGLKGLLQAAGVYKEEIDMDMNLPQSLSGGFYHEPSDRLALMGDLAWVDFSEFGKVDISVGPISTSSDANYRDIWAWSFGAEYELSHRWTAGAGVTYISSGVSDGNRTLALPWDEFWIFGAGVQRQLNPALRLHVNFMYVHGGDGKIDQESSPLSGRLVGQYSQRRTFALDVAFVWGR